MSQPCSNTFFTITSLHSFTFFMKCFLLLVCMLFSCFSTPQMSVSVVCNWILTTVSHSSASVHCWPCGPCPVLSAKEMRSIKVANACVRALLRRKRRRLAKGVLFVATRVCPRRVAIAGHVIKVKLNRRGNTHEYISVNGEAAFSSLQTMW